MLNKARLILLRHAKSDWYSGVPGDFDRPLAARGRKDAPRVGKWMKKNGIVPELILCSPAVRTRETLAAVIGKLGVGHIVYEDAIYGASLAALLGLVEDYSRDCSNLMVTGHNPGMDELLCFLCGTQPPLTETGKAYDHRGAGGTRLCRRRVHEQTGGRRTAAPGEAERNMKRGSG